MYIRILKFFVRICQRAMSKNVLNLVFLAVGLFRWGKKVERYLKTLVEMNILKMKKGQ